MEAFVQFLRQVGVIASLWGRRELIRIRRSLILAIGIAAFFILPGAFLEPLLGWTGKAVWLYVGMAITMVVSTSLAYFRVVSGTAASAAAASLGSAGVATPAGRLRRAKRITAEGIEGYIRFVAGLLASQLAAGLIALFIPAHRDPAAAILILPATMVFITYWIWRKGEFWWPRLVNALGVLTLVIALGRVFFPKTASLVGGLGFDGMLSAFLRGQASQQVGFWLIVGLLVARFFLIVKVPAAYQAAARRGSFWLLVALVFSWAMWGNARAIPGSASPQGNALPQQVDPLWRDIGTIAVVLEKGEWTRVGHLIKVGMCFTFKPDGGRIDKFLDAYGEEHPFADEYRSYQRRGISAIWGQGQILIEVFPRIKLRDGKLTCDREEAARKAA